MLGLAEKSIVMGLDDAKEYVSSKIIVLEQRRYELLEELETVEIELQAETRKLYSLNNPPQLG